MWIRSVAKSNGDGNRWEFGIFNLDDPVCTVPLRPITVVQGMQGWTDLEFGCPSEGCQVAVIPAGWAFGWLSPTVKAKLEVHPDKQDITISCSADGCPVAGPTSQGSIVLTADHVHG